MRQLLEQVLTADGTAALQERRQLTAEEIDRVLAEPPHLQRVSKHPSSTWRDHD